MILLSEIEHSILVPVLSEVVVSLLLFAGGYFIGKYREKLKSRGKNLDEYDFYPFEADKNNVPQFNLKDFRLAVHYFLKNKDFTAASLVASHPIPHTVSVGYKIVPPVFKTCNALFTSVRISGLSIRRK